MAPKSPIYTQEEVNAILRRALTGREDLTDGVTHADLVETAREVGIEPEALERAVAEERRERDRLAVRADLERRRRAAFVSSLLTWAIVSALCFAIDALTAGGPWFQWVLIPWGIVILFSAVRLLREPSARAIARVEKQRERERRRIERARSRQALLGTLERSAGHIERVVEDGAHLLLEHLERVRRLPGRDPHERHRDGDRRRDERDRTRDAARHRERDR